MLRRLYLLISVSSFAFGSACESRASQTIKATTEKFTVYPNRTANSITSQYSYGSSGLLSEQHASSSSSHESSSSQGSINDATGIGVYIAAGLGISSTAASTSSTPLQELSTSTANVSSVSSTLHANTNASQHASTLLHGTAPYVASNSSLHYPYGTAGHMVNSTSSSLAAKHGNHSQVGPTASGIAHGTACSSGRPRQNGNRTFIPPFGSGYAYANACNKASVSWTSKFFTETYITASIYKPTSFTSAVPTSDVYTLCDGIPRLRSGVTTQERPFVSLQQLIQLKRQPSAGVNCSISPRDCSSLLLSYSSKHQVPASASLGPIHTTYEPFILDDFPRCQTNTVLCGKPGADCALSGSGIQLFYWPQTWADGYCGNHKEIVTLGPTIPGKANTATWNNYTFTSPTVYVKYDAISAHDVCGTNFGPTLTDGVIPMPSESVSSKVPYFMTNIPWNGPSGLMYIGREVGISNAVGLGWPGINPDYGDARVPVTYPDLDPETVPAIPYYQRQMDGGDPWCYYGGCPTMMPWAYHPKLDVPEQARSLASEWLSCTLAWGAMDDPPSALAPMSSIIMPTVPTPVVETTSNDPVAPTTGATPCITAQPVPETASSSRSHTRAANTNTAIGGSDPSAESQSQGSRDHAPTGGPNNVASPLSTPEPGTPQPTPGRQHITLSGAGILATSAASPGPDGASLDPSDVSQSHGGAILTPVGSSAYVIDGSTLLPGGSAIEVSGTKYSIDPSGSSVYIDESPTPIATRGHDHADGSVVTIGPDVLTVSRGQHDNGAIVLGSQTVSIGGPAATIDGQVISAAHEGAIVVNGATRLAVSSPYHSVPPDLFSQAAVTIDGHILTGIEEPSPTGTGRIFVLGDNTLNVGGPPITLHGAVLSAGFSGVVVHDSTSRMTVPYSPLGSRETMLAVRGTPLLFSEIMVTSRGFVVTKYIHGSMTLTETIIGSGSSRKTEFVAVSAGPPTIKALTRAQSRVDAAAVSKAPTTVSTSPRKSGSGGSDDASILLLMGCALSCITTIFWTA